MEAPSCEHVILRSIVLRVGKYGPENLVAHIHVEQDSDLVMVARHADKF